MSTTHGEDADESARRLTAVSNGRGVAIAQVIGNVFIRVFGDRDKKWRLPPFFVVVALVAVTQLRSPGGPQDQFSWIYALMGVAVVATAVRALAIVDSEQRNVVITLAAFLCVAGAFVWMEYVRSHGEVDVTGRVAVTPQGPVSNGDRLVFGLEDTPYRSHLRLTFAVSDADPRNQSCVPDTTLGLLLTGRGRPVEVDRVVGGRAVDIPLGGLRSSVSASVTVHVLKGCVMNVSVANAVLHD